MIEHAAEVAAIDPGAQIIHPSCRHPGHPRAARTRGFASAYPAALQACLREGKDSPNTKYRSRSALLQERASKLVSGGRELTARVEPAMIGREA